MENTTKTNAQELKAVEALKEKLYTDINESGLTIVPVYYIMKDLMNEIILIYNNELKNIQKEAKTEEIEESKEEYKVLEVGMFPPSFFLV